jgi:hypothetical protein
MEYPDFEAMFDEAFQSLAEASGETKPELAYTGTVDGSMFVNPLRRYNREVFAYTKVGGNTKPSGSIILDSKAGIFYEDSPENLNRPVWIVTRKGRRTIVDLALVQGTAASEGLTPLEEKIRNIETVKARNVTAGDVSAGDVGYVSYNATYGTEFLRTSTAELNGVAWGVALNEGSSGSTLFIARRGRYYLNYTGTAPTAGQFLTTSANAGLVQARTLFHPAVMAIAAEDGLSNGKVLAQLLTQSEQFNIYAPGVNILQLTGSSNTGWTGTINTGLGSLTSTNVPISTSTGSTNTWFHTSTDLAKVRLRNLTRGNTRLVTSGSGANVTTVASTDNWANGDSLSITSVALGSAFADLDFTQQTSFPKNTRSLILNLSVSETSTTSPGIARIHPIVGSGLDLTIVTQVYSGHNTSYFPQRLGIVPLNDEIMAYSVVASGVGTCGIFVRLHGYYLAVP